MFTELIHLAMHDVATLQNPNVPGTRQEIEAVELSLSETKLVAVTQPHV